MTTNYEKLRALTVEEFAKWLYKFIDENEVHPDEKWILDFLKKDTEIY